MSKVEAQPRFGVFLCDGEFGEESEVSFGGLDPRRASFNIGMTAVDDSYVGTIWDFDGSLQNLKPCFRWQGHQYEMIRRSTAF